MSKNYEGPVMSLAPTTFYSSSLRSKYFPHLIVLKHLQSHLMAGDQVTSIQTASTCILICSVFASELGTKYQILGRRKGRQEMG